ncbi:hypothetical protein LAM40_25420, partial [Mycobacterium tuberculosis]|nr:hypothetical protein [Mycobacterium tuberculosis]
ILMCSGDVIGLILSIINLFSLILTFANSKDVTVFIRAADSYILSVLCCIVTVPLPSEMH